MRLFAAISLLFWGTAMPLSAQHVLKTHHDTTEAKTAPVKVTVINPNGKQPMKYQGRKMAADSVQQALKINFLQFARGEFSLYYEYRLSDAFSVEAGAGITYVDYIHELFVNEGRFISKSAEGKNVRFLSGFSGRAQLRWYPSRYETAISGFYLAPDFSRRNWQMDYLVNTGLINEPHRLNRSWTELRVQAGFQDADPYENLFWEWYVAAGFRYVDEDVVKGSGADAVFITDKYWEPVISGGIKLGFTL
jgi:hypothetical protein